MLTQQELSKFKTKRRYVLKDLESTVCPWIQLRLLIYKEVASIVGRWGTKLIRLYEYSLDMEWVILIVQIKAQLGPVE
jgi:hypothetical protein